MAAATLSSTGLALADRTQLLTAGARLGPAGPEPGLPTPPGEPEQGSPPGPPSPARRPSAVRAIASLVLGAMVGQLALLGVVSAAAALGLLPPTFTVLVLGTDQRPGEVGDPGRTDSILLVGVPRAAAGLGVVSVPRDLWVSVPGYGEARINTAYRTGELAGAGSGLDLAKRTVSQALGAHIDRVVVLDMNGVRQLVDRLGGIDLLVPETIVDDSYPTDEYGVRKLVIPAGPQHLDGEAALAYARTRHADSDFGRMGRQQAVLGAILARVREPSVLPRLPAALAALHQSLRTDLTLLDVASLGLGVFNLSGFSIRHLVIGPELVAPLVGADGAALLQPRASLQPAVAQFLGAGPKTRLP